MTQEKRGLTFGELRQTLYAAEERVQTVRVIGTYRGDPVHGSSRATDLIADLVHVFGMTLIQIAQELNEIKTILSDQGSIGR